MMPNSLHDGTYSQKSLKLDGLWTWKEENKIDIQSLWKTPEIYLLTQAKF